MDIIYDKLSVFQIYSFTLHQKKLEVSRINFLSKATNVSLHSGTRDQTLHSVSIANSVSYKVSDAITDFTEFYQNLPKTLHF